MTSKDSESINLTKYPSSPDTERRFSQASTLDASRYNAESEKGHSTDVQSTTARGASEWQSEKPQSASSYRVDGRCPCMSKRDKLLSGVSDKIQPGRYPRFTVDYALRTAVLIPTMAVLYVGSCLLCSGKSECEHQRSSDGSQGTRE
jgi:hypothetical protein